MTRVNSWERDRGPPPGRFPDQRHPARKLAECCGGYGKRGRSVFLNRKRGRDGREREGAERVARANDPKPKLYANVPWKMTSRQSACQRLFSNGAPSSPTPHPTQPVQTARCRRWAKLAPGNPRHFDTSTLYFISPTVRFGGGSPGAGFRPRHVLVSQLKRPCGGRCVAGSSWMSQRRYYSHRITPRR